MHVTERILIVTLLFPILAHPRRNGSQAAYSVRMVGHTMKIQLRLRNRHFATAMRQIEFLRAFLIYSYGLIDYLITHRSFSRPNENFLTGKNSSLHHSTINGKFSPEWTLLILTDKVVDDQCRCYLG